jgi:hypothetical protein
VNGVETLKRLLVEQSGLTPEQYQKREQELDLERGRQVVAEAAARGVDLAHATESELRHLGASARLAEALELVREKNQIRRRAHAGGPVTEQELEQDRAYWRVYGLPVGCVVEWADGRRTVVDQDGDGRLRHRPVEDGGQP